MTERTIRRKKQVAESVQLLEQGLRSCLTQGPYQDITIKALAQAAGVSPRTFYRHFKSIDDLLLLMINRQVLRFYQEMAGTQPANFTALIVFLFHFFQPEKTLLSQLAANHLLHMVQESFTQHLDADSLAPLVAKDNPLIYYFGVGGIGNLLAYWTSVDFAISEQALTAQAAGLRTYLGALSADRLPFGQGYFR
ncbi:TetR/AcrR family transcriptional regulator [Leuconostocaceae bacterium ESL0958]|nr:TetR/AcrR family transcriptional regulator [Leuconostocaceae bacterium ESL0958]